MANELTNILYDQMTTSSSVCQCCLDGAGEFRNMLDEYLHNGLREVYHDMILTCLSIQIPICTVGEFLICLQCIEKLRDAAIFKQQIEESQKALKSLKIAASETVQVKEEPFFHDMDRNDSDDDDDNDFDFGVCKQEYISSDDVLQRALERTQRNLKLLKNQIPEKIENDVDDSENNSAEQRSDTEDEPKDKKERKKYLDKKRKKKNIFYKLNRDDRVCKLCQQTFPSYKRLLLHMPEHFPNHICNHCGKVFVHKKHLIRHINCTHSNIRVACPTCAKLVKKESLRRHMNIHTGNNLFLKCHYCPERFTGYGSQLNHMMRNHGYKGNEYKCNMCSKVFKLSSELTKHVKCVHFGEKRYTCKECNKQFFSGNQLKMHVLKHTQEKNFECDVCHKKYGRKYTLTEHMKIHNNVKNYICPVCSRAFTQKCTLRSHIKLHEK